MHENAKNYIGEVLRLLPQGSVNKTNLRKNIFDELEILERNGQPSPISKRQWQILINETWEQARHDLVKLYKEPQGQAIAVFINQRHNGEAMQCFSLMDGHNQATQEYLRTRCTRIKSEEAPELVSYLLKLYAFAYNTDRPILL
jgi:hypothetical protein